MERRSRRELIKRHGDIPFYEDIRSYVMKPAERDALLARLDERTRNMWHTLDEKDDSITKKLDRVISHQEKQNGRISKNRLMILSLASLLVGAGVLEWLDVIRVFG